MIDFLVRNRRLGLVLMYALLFVGVIAALLEIPEVLIPVGILLLVCMFLGACAVLVPLIRDGVRYDQTSPFRRRSRQIDDELQHIIVDDAINHTDSAEKLKQLRDEQNDLYIRSLVFYPRERDIYIEYLQAGLETPTQKRAIALEKLEDAPDGSELKAGWQTAVDFWNSIIEDVEVKIKKIETLTTKTALEGI